VTLNLGKNMSDRRRQNFFGHFWPYGTDGKVLPTLNLGFYRVPKFRYFLLKINKFKINIKTILLIIYSLLLLLLSLHTYTQTQ
jgi:hypothetical protein